MKYSRTTWFNVYRGASGKAWISNAAYPTREMADRYANSRAARAARWKRLYCIRVRWKIGT